MKCLQIVLTNCVNKVAYDWFSRILSLFLSVPSDKFEIRLGKLLSMDMTKQNVDSNAQNRKKSKFHFTMENS